MMVDLGGEKGAIDEDEQEMDSKRLRLWRQLRAGIHDATAATWYALDIESTDGEILRR